MKKMMYKQNDNGTGFTVAKPERCVLVTHNDLDGAGCAVVALLTGVYEMYFCSNGKDIDDTVTAILDEYENEGGSLILTIADNSVSKEVADRIDNMHFNYEYFEPSLLDHHASALWLQDEYEWACIDTSECGTTMMYNDIFERTFYDENIKNMVKEFCNTVKDRDLWLWEEKGNQNANIYNESMRILGIQEYVLRTANNITDGNYIISADDERDALNMIAEKDKYVEEHSDNYFKDSVTIAGREYQVAFTFASKYTSELGNAICEKHDDIDICAIICTHRGEYGTVELRATKDDVDLSPIAKGLGGGGHKHAAGFPLKKDFAESTIGVFANMMSKAE